MILCDDNEFPQTNPDPWKDKIGLIEGFPRASAHVKISTVCLTNDCFPNLLRSI